MGLSGFLQKTLGHFGRSAAKKESLRRIANGEQRNDDVVNLHRYDPTNIGDFWCGPHHYFEQLKGKHLDIFDYKRENDEQRNNFVEKVTANSLIIGGGGLLNREGFNLQLDLFADLGSKGKKTVLWGVGHNGKNASQFGKEVKYNVDTSKFGLVGVRDYGRKEEWVPCVSCLHPIFDNKHEVTNEVGIIFHKKTLRDQKLVDKFKGYPSTSNDSDFEEVVKFIQQTDTLITDSYHAMYWSLMLGKKVLVIPNSTKFYDFKYEPVITTFDSFKDDLKKARSYTGVMDDCRETNLRFSEKVFNYLNV